MRLPIVIFLTFAMLQVTAFAGEKTFSDLLVDAVTKAKEPISKKARKKLKEYAKVIPDNKKIQDALKKKLVPRVMICFGSSMTLLFATAESGSCDTFLIKDGKLKRDETVRYSISGGGFGAGMTLENISMNIVFSKSEDCELVGTEFDSEITAQGGTNTDQNGNPEIVFRKAKKHVPSKETCGSGSKHYIAQSRFDQHGAHIAIGSGKMKIEPEKSSNCAY